MKTDPDEDDGECSISDRYPLYAITGEKELAKRFEQERNMHKFKKIVSKITKEEYVDYTNLNRMRLLKLRTLDTNMKESKTGTVSIVMTENEYQNCDPEMMYIALFNEDFWRGSLYPPEVYNKKIRKALEFIDYNVLYKVNKGGSIEEQLEAGREFDMPRIDTYNYFIETYIDTFL